MNRKRQSLASLLLVLCLAPSALRAEVVNRIVLRVNDRIATLYDYQQRKAETAREILRRIEDPQERQQLLGQAGESVYAEMFRELLLDSRGDQLGIEVSEAEVDAQMAQIRQNFNIKTDEEFAAALAQSGMTEAQLRAQIRGSLRMQEVRGREVQSRVKVDEEDLRRYYRKNLEQFRQPEQLQIREVVVLEESSLGDDERRRIAGEIQAKVQAGSTLADAVAEHAKNGATSNVIELGWVSPGDLDKSLETAVWKLPVGTLSEPVPARGGLHLAQIIERREARIPPFAEVAEAIQAREQDRVFREEVAKYMTELEKKSLIVANPPEEAAGFRRRLDTAESDEPGGLGSAPTSAPSPPPAPAPAVDTPPELAPAVDPTRPGNLPTPKPVDTTVPEIPPPGA